MLWLEMSRDFAHGGAGWEFSRCLWSPAYKNDAGRSKWPYWQSLLRVRSGENVLHLRGVGKAAAFVGMSVCASPGFATSDRPPVAGQWSYAETFYQVALRDWREFSQPVFLQRVFDSRRKELTAYFLANKARRDEKRRLFYVHQAGRLQCLNGAYLSEIDGQLAELLLQDDIPRTDENQQPRLNRDVVPTAEAARQILMRLGQDAFSEAVRSNYGHRCCVPGCDITDDVFLVGSHIARWADVPSLRGHLSNGLSLCLMHDKAFENGFFTFNKELRIVVTESGGDATAWIAKYLVSAAGERIRASSIEPSTEALQHHWLRHGFAHTEAD
jgi:putative restriction endonuclease